MKTYRYRLNLQFFSQEKTEKATPKKRKDAREKGQVAKSMEVPGAFILLFVFISFLLLGGYFKEQIYGLFTVALHDYMLMDITYGNLQMIFSQLLVNGVLMLLPIFILVVVIALLGNYLQIGFLFTGKPLQPSLSKLSPIKGIKNLFSLRSLVEFVKSLIKICIIGTIVFYTLWNERSKITALSLVDLEHAFSYVAGLVASLGIQVALCLVVLAFFDYFYQKYEYEKGLRMSKQDIKDEHKKMEGDPKVKARIREKQMRMAMQRMMQEVPKADVVITNPTHYAVALSYDQESMEAPVVIAKGKDYVALKIRELAKEHDIVTMENKPLARALYEQVDIGESIPQELFQAVAEVLAYVYKLKRKA